MKNYQLKPFSIGAPMNYEKNLNEQQLQVVKGADGPCLVLAGAGSGKTRVLIYRLAYLLERGINPQEILLVTFTNKAAGEMTHRAEMLLKSSLIGLWAGTFHHIGNVTLRKEAHLLNYSNNFTIVDKQDSLDLIEDCLEEMGFLKKEKLFPKKDVIATVWDLAANSQKELPDVIEKFYPQIQEYTSDLKRIFSHYQNKKRKANVMDFNDLLVNWLEVLRNKNICEKYSKGFKYILVDEYQDTNRLQFEILKLLSSVNGNILVVGDDAQSIYSFRAAEISNILDFPKTFKNANIFKLEINYRSTPQVLNMANEIIKHNIHQFPKTLRAIKKKDERPLVVKTKDVYQQAKFVAQRVLELYREGIPLKEMAVLFRSRFQALELEVELIKRNIPYIIRGGMKFFEQAHIKDTLSYLKIILNPRDELSFKRAVCLHKGIGRSFAYKIWNKFSTNNDLKSIKRELPKRQQEGFKEFSLLFESLKTIKSPEKAIRKILKFYKNYCYLSFDNPDERILDLEELAKMATTYNTIREFLLDLGSFEEFKGETMLSSAEKEEILVLSTIHQAKGLEWEAVFIIGFSDYEFPHPKSLGSDSALEEERRLFYVATTRTKSLLHVIYPETKYTFKNGLIITRPSMFFFELPGAVYEEMAVEEPHSHYYE